ncbi:MAG TPA: MFS transporter [Tepidisphaeraceae bacterium]|nr:MFS transporter [Tepidisphaeraceae bacterium]
MPAPMLSYAPAPPATRGAYKWWVVFMLWFICFLNYADRQAISAIFPKLQEEFGFDKEQLGLIGSAFMWVYAFGAPLAGYIGDRVRRKELILGGCIFWSLITVLTGRCTRLWQFVTVRASEGFGETFYFPASMSLISDYHGPQTRSKALSFHQSSVYVGTVAGTWIAALLAQHYGWRLGFYFFGAAGIVLAIVLFALLREPGRGMSESLDQTGKVRLPASELLASVLAQPTAVLLMLAFLGANFVATIFLVWAPTFLVEKFHYTLSTAGFSGTAFIHLTSAVSAPLGGVMADALARRRPGGRMLVQASGLLIGAGFVFLVAVTDRTPVLLVSMTLFGFCKGLYDSNIFASLYDVVEPRARATAAGFMNTVGWGGGALGPLYVGYFALHGRYSSQIQNMSHAIALTAGIYIVSGVLLLVAARLCARRADNPVTMR